MRLALINDSTRRDSPMVVKYLKQTIEGVSAAAGVDVDFTTFAAAPEQRGSKVPPIAVIRAERARLLDELTSWRPDAVVTMGTAAMHALGSTTTMLQLRKELGRMRWLDGTGIPWTPTVAPIHVVRHGDLHRDFINVVYKAVTQLAPLEPTDVSFVVPTDIDALRASLDELDGASVVGVDVETTGLRPYRDDLLALGIGAYGRDGNWGQAVIITPEMLEDDDVRDLAWDAVWRASRRSVGHNFKFDMQFIERYAGWPPNGASLGDTLLLAHLLDERPVQMNTRARGSGLKDLVAMRYDHQYGFDFGEFYAQPDEEKDWGAMHAYLAEDCVYTARLWHDLHAEAVAESDRLVDAHTSFLVPVSIATARAEFTGAPVDLGWVKETVRILERRVARRQAALERAIAHLAPTLVTTNILAPSQVADVIYGEWGWKPDLRRKHGKDRSTDAENMKAIIARYGKSTDPVDRRRARWCAALMALRKDARLVTVYEKSILQRVDTDGRLRSSFKLHGASTGRISSEAPNLQNVPAVDEIDAGPPRKYKVRDGSWVSRPMRRAFAPTPPMLWAEVDYSQLELRVAAGISGDRAFGDVFRERRDIHREVAAAVFSKAPEEVAKGERFIAKAVSFGILYGRSAGAIADGEEMNIAEREHGLTRWTTEQAEAFILQFRRSYPELQAWINEQHRMAVEDHYVESPHGRRRRFPLQGRDPNIQGAIERQAVNTPIQAEASDICLDAMVRLTAALDEAGLRATVLFPVHDSICIEVHEDDIAALEPICREVMEIDFRGVPLTVDFEYGPSWADVEKH